LREIGPPLLAVLGAIAAAPPIDGVERFKVLYTPIIPVSRKQDGREDVKFSQLKMTSSFTVLGGVQFTLRTRSLKQSYNTRETQCWGQGVPQAGSEELPRNYQQ
jgi:hypothetical protein